MTAPEFEESRVGIICVFGELAVCHEVAAFGCVAVGVRRFVKRNIGIYALCFAAYKVDRIIVIRRIAIEICRSFDNRHSFFGIVCGFGFVVRFAVGKNTDFFDKQHFAFLLRDSKADVLSLYREGERKNIVIII